MRRRSQQAKTMQMDSKDAEIARKFPASSSKRLMPGSLSWSGVFLLLWGFALAVRLPRVAASAWPGFSFTNF